jgi:membrane protein DedA with SNARE-associated domain
VPKVARDEPDELIHQYGYAFVLAACWSSRSACRSRRSRCCRRGAFAANGDLGAARLVLAVLGAIAGDSCGSSSRRFGARLLALCGLRSSPERCAEDRDTLFARFGLKSLLVTRFVPGLAALGPSLAGVAGYRRRHFAAFDAMGAVLWAGTALVLGVAFHREIDRLLLLMQAAGAQAAAVVGARARRPRRDRLAVRDRLGRGRSLIGALRGTASPCGCR